MGHRRNVFESAIETNLHCDSGGSES
ncbi:hypothetical protein Ahy_B05g078464 isoform B [Arachis hypogaea]|uniref:Uncharacterized protein n=1 Tax=Arachis hypogaea TaxID=3818 RepID=A0A444Z751_ARAHY|nr:hypothetical protein Ahy_B05g078464 isoform B [Arachis hypogaea]